ncbi:MAG: hypothetical protein HQM10_15720 [Candidatus Riflebacteria bacterium]|nr:hypothetical protein [Candidatus Riflebacteria bacterium]
MNNMRKRAFTIIEITIGSAIFVLLMFAAYRLFFSQVRYIKSSLEQVGINENFRSFHALFGNDVRNANLILLPELISRKDAQKIPPAVEGIFCSLEKQAMDLHIQPPQADFIKRVKITWRLKAAPDGTFDIHRDVDSEIPAEIGGHGPYKGSRKVCEGVKELYIFSSFKEPPQINNMPAINVKPTLSFPSYDSNGTGRSLLHVRISFVKKKSPSEKVKDSIQVTLRTCFAIRGNANWVNQ